MKYLPMSEQHTGSTGRLGLEAGLGDGKQLADRPCADQAPWKHFSVWLDLEFVSWLGGGRCSFLWRWKTILAHSQAQMTQSRGWRISCTRQEVSTAMRQLPPEPTTVPAAAFSLCVLGPPHSLPTGRKRPLGLIKCRQTACLGFEFSGTQATWTLTAMDRSRKSVTSRLALRPSVCNRYLQCPGSSSQAG